MVAVINPSPDVAIRRLLISGNIFCEVTRPHCEFDLAILKYGLAEIHPVARRCPFFLFFLVFFFFFFFFPEGFPFNSTNPKRTCPFFSPGNPQGHLRPVACPPPPRSRCSEIRSTSWARAAVFGMQVELLCVASPRTPLKGGLVATFCEKIGDPKQKGLLPLRGGSSNVPPKGKKTPLIPWGPMSEVQPPGALDGVSEAVCDAQCRDHSGYFRSTIAKQNSTEPRKDDPAPRCLSRLDTRIAVFMSMSHIACSVYETRQAEGT